jgi:hypothetical protein
MGTMEKNRMPLQGLRENARVDGLTIHGSCDVAEFFALREQLAVRTRKSRELCAEARRNFDELRSTHMKHTILLAQVKLSCLEGSELCSVLALPRGESRPRPYGIPIQ